LLLTHAVAETYPRSQILADASRYARNRKSAILCETVQQQRAAALSRSLYVPVSRLEAQRPKADQALQSSGMAEGGGSGGDAAGADGQLTERFLKQMSQSNELYRTPSLNEKLYLPHKGIASLGSALERYTGLKSLFLEGNALESLAGLSSQPALRCLFCGKNDLQSLDGIENVPLLATLDVSNNRLCSLAGIEHLHQLGTLMASSNKFSDLQSVCSELSSLSDVLHTLDLSNNSIDGDPEHLVHAMSHMRGLAALYLKGNPVVSKMQAYRKRLIAEMPSLNYLDDRPVGDTERRCALAWLSDGLEAEQAERQRARDEEAERHAANREHLSALRNAAAEARAQREADAAAAESDDDSDNADNREHAADFDKDIEDEDEPEELKQAREKLAEFDRKKNEGVGDTASASLPELE